MLRLRTSILTHRRSSSSVVFPNICSHLHRLLSATAPAPPISANPSFPVGDYLVGTCGLTRIQAIRASAKLSHLKSPSKPDAVLAFLSGLGVSSADVAAAVAKDPRLLCAKVDQTVAPNVAELTSLGLTRPDIARLVSFARDRFRCRSIVSKLQYYLRLFASSDNLFRALKNSRYLLTSSLDKVVQPNVILLRDCGLSDCDIAKLCLHVKRMLATNPARLRADGGMRRRSRCAPGLWDVPMHASGCRFPQREKVAAKVEYLKNTFRWSDAEVGSALCKAPMILRRSKESLQLRLDCLISELGSNLHTLLSVRRLSFAAWKAG